MPAVQPNSVPDKNGVQQEEDAKQPTEPPATNQAKQSTEVPPKRELTRQELEKMSRKLLPHAYDKKTGKGRWDYMQILGEGSYGIIWKARDMQMERCSENEKKMDTNEEKYVAIKVSKYISDTPAVYMMHREYLMSRQIHRTTKHQYFVEYLEDWTHFRDNTEAEDRALERGDEFRGKEMKLWRDKLGDLWREGNGKLLDPNKVDYVVMELLDRNVVPFRSKIKKNLYSLTETRMIMVQLLESLAFLRKELLAHRDFRIANLLWDDKEKKVKIVDFGLMIKCEDGMRHSDSPVIQINVQDSNYWMPPETKSHDAAVFGNRLNVTQPNGYQMKCNYEEPFYSFDMYSLSFILHELVCNRLPQSNDLREVNVANQQFLVSKIEHKDRFTISRDAQIWRGLGLDPAMLLSLSCMQANRRPSPDKVLQSLRPPLYKHLGMAIEDPEKRRGQSVLREVCFMFGIADLQRAILELLGINAYGGVMPIQKSVNIVARREPAYPDLSKMNPATKETLTIERLQAKSLNNESKANEILKIASVCTCVFLECSKEYQKQRMIKHLDDCAEKVCALARDLVKTLILIRGAKVLLWREEQVGGQLTPVLKRWVSSHLVSKARRWVEQFGKGRLVMERHSNLERVTMLYEEAKLYLQRVEWATFSDDEANDLARVIKKAEKVKDKVTNGECVIEKVTRAKLWEVHSKVVKRRAEDAAKKESAKTAEKTECRSLKKVVEDKKTTSSSAAAETAEMREKSLMKSKKAHVDSQNAKSMKEVHNANTASATANHLEKIWKSTSQISKVVSKSSDGRKKTTIQADFLKRTPRKSGNNATLAEKLQVVNELSAKQRRGSRADDGLIPGRSSLLGKELGKKQRRGSKNSMAPKAVPDVADDFSHWKLPDDDIYESFPDGSQRLTRQTSCLTNTLNGEEEDGKVAVKNRERGKALNSRATGASSSGLSPQHRSQSNHSKEVQPTAKETPEKDDESFRQMFSNYNNFYVSKCFPEAAAGSARNIEAVPGLSAAMLEKRKRMSRMLENDPWLGPSRRDAMHGPRLTEQVVPTRREDLASKDIEALALRHRKEVPVKGYRSPNANRPTAFRKRTKSLLSLSQKFPTYGMDPEGAEDEPPPRKRARLDEPTERSLRTMQTGGPSNRGGQRRQQSASSKTTARPDEVATVPKDRAMKRSTASKLIGSANVQAAVQPNESRGVQNRKKKADRFQSHRYYNQKNDDSSAGMPKGKRS